MSARRVQQRVALAAFAAAVLLAVVGFNTRRWVGTTFPGFFVMANRVVASVALPEWLAEPSLLFQHQVVAVDGVAVRDAGAVYDLVQTHPPGTPVRYTLRTPAGGLTTAVAAARRFSWLDYTLIFGAYFLNGLAFVATALLVYRLKPASPASEGFLAAGLTTGLFIVTAADLYGPHWFFRLHVIAEALMGAGFIHLALVFPTDRLRERRRPVLIALYVPFVLLAAWYEIALGSPAAYTQVHLIATALDGLAAGATILAVCFDFLMSRSALVRRRTGVVVLGTVCGFLVPGVVMITSALLGGEVPLNAAALTAFLFPLSLGYAVVAHDLFEIDLVLRRGITYVLVLMTIATVYFGILLAIASAVPHPEMIARSPIVLALVNLGLLFLVAPVRTRLQAAVDRVFFRTPYDAEDCLSELSHALAAAHTVEDVADRARAILLAALTPVDGALFLLEGDGVFRHRGHSRYAVAQFELPAEWLGRLVKGTIVARYEWDDGSGRGMPPIWATLRADLLVPVGPGPDLVGAFVLGAKNSGHAYTLHDVGFLTTAASQLALALRNAEAFEEIKRAYRQLEQNQASLMRADRLATLGRLAAGMAHEVSTPLAAVLNSLKVASDLGQECTASMAPPDEHRPLVEEMVVNTQNAMRWARKAAAFISKVKMHGRDSRVAGGQEFTVRAVAAETQALLAHRLRATSCQLEFHEEPADVTLTGEATRLGQVLVNLVENAIDAYEDAGITDGRIEISARRRDASVIVSVRDRAGGIPPHVVSRIFEELFTTKEPGRGTGLGLWIARNLVEESFGGTLTVESTPGSGSCFAAVMPATAATRRDLSRVA